MGNPKKIYALEILISEDHLSFIIISITKYKVSSCITDLIYAFYSSHLLDMSSGVDPDHDKFYHPYQPYDIQLKLMKCIYDTLEYNNTHRNSNDKKICILESPTGTGKTLSLICSTVTWLRDNKRNLLQAEGKNNGNNGNDNDSDFDSENDSDEPEWVNETFQDNLLKDKIDEFISFETHLNEINKNVKSLNLHKGQQQRHHQKKQKKKKIEISIEDNEFIPTPYNENGLTDDNKMILSNEVKSLLNKIDATHNNKRPERNLPLLNNPIKIFFASRTHSQLNQLANQLSLPKFPSSFKELETERVKFLPLASKKQLCINPDVNKWGTVEAINDACYELRHRKGGCPFYKIDRDTSPFTDEVFESIHDIEDLYTIGEKHKMCPYYASRDALPGVEVITLPYQYLLSETTRQAMKLDLKNNIVVIDEAHNLIDTINSIHSSQVSLRDLQVCHLGLQTYLQKFKLRLNPGNRVNLLKLLKLLSIFIKFIQENFKKPGVPIDDFTEFFKDNNADTLNIHNLIKYINMSKVAYKIDTYIKSLQENESESNSSASKPTLFKIVSFLTSLTNPSKEGQFFFDAGPSIKYMLLEPSKLFESIVDETKCVILAGGTMEPMNEFNDMLFPQLNKNQIVEYSCNHIIPDENLKTFIVNEPGLEFTFANRGNLSLINDTLFQFYMNLCDNVPAKGGIVGFFPSYQFLGKVINNWKKNGLFEKINNKRSLFYESKNGKDPLNEYTEIINDPKNEKRAILFAVVGGRLSEGINFQDNLCRAIVMTGLPYPNLLSGELQIKKRHLEMKVEASNKTKPNSQWEDPKVVVKNFLDNLCMKAVNQSVGRSIRHINDYSIIILFDNRYDRDSIKNKLSHWVRKRIQPQLSVTPIMHSIKTFFENKNTGH